MKTTANKNIFKYERNISNCHRDGHIYIKFYCTKIQHDFRHNTVQVIQTPDPACSLTKFFITCLEGELCLIIQSPFHLMEGERNCWFFFLWMRSSTPFCILSPLYQTPLCKAVYLNIHLFLVKNNGNQKKILGSYVYLGCLRTAFWPLRQITVKIIIVEPYTQAENQSHEESVLEHTAALPLKPEHYAASQPVKDGTVNSYLSSLASGLSVR